MNAMGVGTVNFVVLVILGALPLAAARRATRHLAACRAAGSRSRPRTSTPRSGSLSSSRRMDGEGRLLAVVHVERS